VIGQDVRTVSGESHATYRRRVIKNAVIHMNAEQPLLVDLDALPAATDVGLVCTNLRYVDGRKPSFIDHTDSWFVFPLSMIRFLEVPRREVDAASVLQLPAGPLAEEPEELDDPDADEDLLRRIREA
jgi:hypothetical protein